MKTFLKFLFLIIGFGFINALILSWSICNISQLYQIPFLSELNLWQIYSLFLIKSVIEGGTVVEVEKRKAEAAAKKLPDDEVAKSIFMYFFSRSTGIMISVGIAHLIYKIYLS